MNIKILISNGFTNYVMIGHPNKVKIVSYWSGIPLRDWSPPTRIRWTRVKDHKGETAIQIAEDETKTWLPMQTMNALTKLFGDISFRSFVRMLIMDNREVTISIYVFVSQSALSLLPLFFHINQTASETYGCSIYKILFILAEPACLVLKGMPFDALLFHSQ